MTIVAIKPRRSYSLDFDKLHSSYDRSVSFASGITGNRPDAEEVVSAAYLKALRFQDSFNGDCDQKTWFYTIIRNCAIDRLKSVAHSRVSKVSPVVMGRMVENQQANNVFAHGVKTTPFASNPERYCIAVDEIQRYIKACEQLSHRHREILTMRLVEGMSYAEIATQTGSARGTVMSRLFHARKAVAKVLGA